MTKVSIRGLKKSLRRFVQFAAAGGRVMITDHGKVVAVMTHPGEFSDDPRMKKYNELLAAGVIQPATDPSPLLKGIRGIRLPPGTAQQLLDENRKDFDED